MEVTAPSPKPVCVTTIPKRESRIIGNFLYEYEHIVQGSHAKRHAEPSVVQLPLLMTDCVLGFSFQPWRPHGLVILFVCLCTFVLCRNILEPSSGIIIAIYIRVPPLLSSLCSFLIRLLDLFSWKKNFTIHRFITSIHNSFTSPVSVLFPSILFSNPILTDS